MLEISIKKGNDENLYAIANSNNIVNMSLFSFDYREQCGGWLFWFRGELNPEIKEGKEFPMEYFKDLCRALALVIFSEPLSSSEVIKIVSGESYISAAAE